MAPRSTRFFIMAVMPLPGSYSKLYEQFHLAEGAARVGQGLTVNSGGFHAVGTPGKHASRAPSRVACSYVFVNKRSNNGTRRSAIDLRHS